MRWRPVTGCDISIHTLREEGDQTPRRLAPTATRFLSTPSARRATWVLLLIYIKRKISIHTLREEGDGQSC